MASLCRSHLQSPSAVAMKLLLIQHCGVMFSAPQGSASLQDSFSLPQRLFSGMSTKGAIEIEASDLQICAVELITLGSDSIILSRDCRCLTAIHGFLISP